MIIRIGIASGVFSFCLCVLNRGWESAPTIRIVRFGVAALGWNVKSVIVLS